MQHDLAMHVRKCVNKEYGLVVIVNQQFAKLFDHCKL